jgi:hypothetical protein
MILDFLKKLISNTLQENDGALKKRKSNSYNSKEDVLQKLLYEDFFKNFTSQKNRNRIFLKNKEGFNDITFQLKRTVDNRLWDKSKFGLLAVSITPIFGVRFDILSNWFEKYSTKSLHDQRNNPTVCSGTLISKSPKEFYFLENKKDFQKDYTYFKEEVISNATTFFNKYSCLDNYYLHDVLPMFTNEKEIIGSGSDWIFQYLTAVKLIEPNRFNEMATILKKQIEFMNNRSNPNIKPYYEKIDEIFDYLQKLNLSTPEHNKHTKQSKNSLNLI